jgi:hypothetical protein
MKVKELRRQSFSPTLAQMLPVSPWVEDQQGKEY